MLIAWKLGSASIDFHSLPSTLESVLRLSILQVNVLCCRSIFRCRGVFRGRADGARLARKRVAQFRRKRTPWDHLRAACAQHEEAYHGQCNEEAQNNCSPRAEARSLWGSGGGTSGWSSVALGSCCLSEDDVSIERRRRGGIVCHT